MRARAIISAWHQLIFMTPSFSGMWGQNGNKKNPPPPQKREKPTSQVESVHTDVIVGGAQPLAQRHRVSRLLSIMHVNIWRSFSIKLVTFPQQTHPYNCTTEAVVWPKDQHACRMKLCASGYFLVSCCRRFRCCCLTLQQLEKPLLVTSAATWTQKWK